MISSELAIVIVSLLTTVCIAMAIATHFAIKRLERIQSLYMGTIGTLVFMISDARGEFDAEEPIDPEIRTRLEEAKVLRFRNGSGDDSDDDNVA